MKGLRRQNLLLLLLEMLIIELLINSELLTRKEIYDEYDGLMI